MKGALRLARRAPDTGPIDDPVNAEIRRLVKLAFSGDGLDPASDGSARDGDHPPEYAFASYLEGRLAGGAEDAFERHVADCAPCAEELVLARRSGIGEEPSYSRHVWKIAAALAVVLAGLIAALLAAGAVGGRIQGTVLAGIREVLGSKARIDTAALRVRGGPAVDITGLTVADPSGGPPMIAAAQATWQVDLGELRQGRIAGALKLHGPIINVVREPSGSLNIDAILPSSGGGKEDLLARARRKAIDAVEISGGTLRLVDRSGGERREVRMAAVDAAITNLAGDGAAHVAARAGVESTRQNLHVVGDIGPWGQGEKPAYRFPEVALDAVPIRNLPGLGSTMRGGLSFDGALASAGDTWNEISSQFSGSGDLRVVSGSIVGRNLVRDVVSPLLGADDGDPPLPTALASLVAGSDTEFGAMQSPVTIASSRISADAFTATTNGFSVGGRGALANDGQVEFTGELVASEATTRELLAFAPGAGSLVDEHGSIAIPFRVSGRWPEVRVAVDVEKLAHRTVLRRGLARLFFAPLPG
ncbi:MAG TPA: hypothetical protein VFD92_28185 [Candidatus Binatia bacterium]|nr:hypothetical protein [Candidatus Binatia bacterium]